MYVAIVSGAMPECSPVPLDPGLPALVSGVGLDTPTVSPGRGGGRKDRSHTHAHAHCIIKTQPTN